MGTGTFNRAVRLTQKHNVQRGRKLRHPLTSSKPDASTHSALFAASPPPPVMDSLLAPPREQAADEPCAGASGSAPRPNAEALQMSTTHNTASRFMPGLAIVVHFGLVAPARKVAKVVRETRKEIRVQYGG